MKTELPDNVFPRNLDPNNTITTRYVTTTLFPQPGPKSAKSLVDAVANFLDYLEKYQASIIDIISTPRFHDVWKDFYKTLPKISDKRPDPVSQRKPEIWQSWDIWQNTFNDLSGFFNPQEMNGEAIGVIRKQQVRSFASLDKVMQNRKLFRQNMTIASRNPMTANSLATSGKKSLFLDTINEVEGVFEKLEKNQQVAQEEINKAQSTLSTLETNYRIMDFLMHGGWLGDVLVGAKKIAMTEKTFISPAIFSNNTLKLVAVLSLVAQNLPRQISASEILSSENPVKTILENRYKTYRKNSIADQLMNQPDAMAHFVTILYNRHRDLGAWFGFNSPEQPDLNDYLSKDAQREWAFLRHEKLELKLGEPKLRGPIHAESLPPLSSITIKDEASTVAEQVSTLYEATLTAQQLQYGMSSSSKVENIFEKSFYKESDYSDSESMFKTSSELRRNRIDTYIEQESKRNDRLLSEKFSNSKNSQRKYRSQGQDQDNAATELSFQVVTEVEAKVSLEEIGLAWCPRINHPFINLRDHVKTTETKAEEEYKNENKIVEWISSYTPEYDNKSAAPSGAVPLSEIPSDVEFRLTYDLPIELLEGIPDENNSTCNITVDYFTQGKAAWLLFPLPAPAALLVYRFKKAEVKRLETKGSIEARVTFDGDLLWAEIKNQLPIVKYGSELGDAFKYDDFNAIAAVVHFNFNIVFKVLKEESKQQQAEEQIRHSAWLENNAARDGRALQYARMRKNETITLYNDFGRQKQLAFTRLIRELFTESHWSYFHEILKTCIDWEKVQLLFEEARANSEELLFPYIPPDHILNARAARLILPLKNNSETVFFEIMSAATETVVSKNANKVFEYIVKYREYLKSIENQFILDAYNTEMVIGRHCEAVLSKSSFVE